MSKLLIIFLIITIIVCCFYVYMKLKKFNYDDTYVFTPDRVDTVIPKVIIQTYYDKSKIPDKVYKNIRKYAPEYKHIVYDDDDCIEFLTQFNKTFNKTSDFNLVNRFNSYRKGAHKADLFRYCYLYQYGGIYLDIKTELIHPIDELIVNNNTLYTVIAANNNNTIYQGVMAVYPKNPIIGKLVNQCIGAKNIFLFFNYWLLLEFFYKCITNEVNLDKLLPEKYHAYNFDIHLFQEKDCPISDCITKDRYGDCYFIHDKEGNKIIKTRYSDFPW
jgi:mannosyltransferase OCH1-like enzyme